MFVDDDIQRHNNNRKLYQGTYSMTALKTYEPYVDDCVDLFSQRLEEFVQAGLTINLGYWLQCYAFDVIGMITYSKRLGFLDRGEDIGGVIGTLDNLLGYATLTGIYPSVHPYLIALKNRLAGKKGTGRAYVVNYTKECIAEHQARPKAQAIDFDEEQQTGTADFLTKFYQKHTKDPDTFTTYHVAAGCSQNMVAGSDTTAISLSAIMYFMLKHPETFRRLRDEIDEFRQQGRMTQRVEFKVSQEMPYLQAVIKEALRLHAATGTPLERVVPKGGSTICGHFFPEGVSPRTFGYNEKGR